MSTHFSNKVTAQASYTAHTPYGHQHRRVRPQLEMTSRLVPQVYGDQVYFIPGDTSPTLLRRSTSSVALQVPHGAAPQPQGDDIVIRFFTWLGSLFNKAGA